MHRKLFYAFNFLLLGFFLVALFIDHNTEWRHTQKAYFAKTAKAFDEMAAKASKPEEVEAYKRQAEAARNEPIVIRQIIARDLGRVDRCITCHVGMDEFTNPSMTTPLKDHPFTGHPDLAMAGKHSFQKFGCTVCHQGQGLATTAEAAHGKAEFWEKPLLSGKLIQASCAKCHQDFETLKGAETVAMGKQLFYKHGCVGCHSIRAVGGVVSVDLGEIADKPLERIAGYNFAMIKKDGKPLSRHDWKLPAWIEGHLTQRPADFIPNDPFAKYNAEPIAPSGMPDFSHELPAGGAQAITAFLLSMTTENIPLRYAVAAAPKPEPKFDNDVLRGKYVYQKYGCAGCHGLEAKAGRANFNAMGPEQSDHKTDMEKGREPTLPDVVGTYTRDELRKKIQDGVPGSAIAKFNPDGPVPPLYMPAWKDKIKGQELEDLLTYLLSIAKKQESW